jgi:TPR repeat protein
VEALAKGAGVAKDVVAAAHIFRLAADQGFAMAQRAYGECLKGGIGVPRDEVGAARFIEMAAVQGE